MVQKIDGLILAGAALFLAVPAQAQYGSGMNWVINRTRVPAIIQCPGCADAADADMAGPSAPSPQVARPRPPADASTLVYRPSLTARQRNVSEFLRNSALEAASDGDLIAQIDGRMRGVGLSATNVADAYTIWLIGAWEAVHDRDIGDDRTFYQTVNRQVKRSFLTSPAVASLDNAGKQTMAEALLLQALLTGSMVEASAGNPALRRQVAGAVTQGAAQMGVNLHTMRLSADGISYQGQ